MWWLRKRRRKIASLSHETNEETEWNHQKEISFWCVKRQIVGELSLVDNMRSWCNITCCVLKWINNAKCLFRVVKKSVIITEKPIFSFMPQCASSPFLLLLHDIACLWFIFHQITIIYLVLSCTLNSITLHSSFSSSSLFDVVICDAIISHVYFHFYMLNYYYHHHSYYVE